MKSDLEIAKGVKLKEIGEVAESMGLDKALLSYYGPYKAKIDVNKLEGKPSGKLVLISAISPTPSGEGKTTMNIGLSMALNKLGYTSISALREPSLGPCFGMKGGATGGGHAQVLPMEDINLHFTGDFHAITTAHNLLAAMIDNHIFHGNALNLDPDRIVFNRVMDMNDRALRSIDLGYRMSRFDITVTSEIMAILCLSEDIQDLRKRLEKIVVGYTYDDEIIYAKDLKAVGSMVVLLKEAMKPNLVQTSENTPAIIHGGPFANIAHGCNSVIATKTALKLAEYTVTEAGFGSDLGAEKFMNIKCRQSKLAPDVVVLVVTLRALNYHGDHYENMVGHLNHLNHYGVPIVVALNQFPEDSPEDIERLKKHVEGLGYAFEVSHIHANGSEGGLDLAKTVVKLSHHKHNFNYLYDHKMLLHDKIETLVKKVYGGQGVVYSEAALKQLESYETLYPNFEVCMAKTQYSFTDNPKILGAPDHFNIHIQELRVSNGAGFIVCLSGKILTMPGLPKKPAAEKIDLDENQEVIGLY